MTLVCGAWMAAGAAHEVRAQDEASACADTLATAERVYRNRNYQEAVALASQCTDQETVGDDTAIRAYRLITLASLREGSLVEARSAVTSILQIDPEYTADPVTDPPAYDLFVSMVREDAVSEPTADAEADTTGDTDADPAGQEGTEPTESTPARPRPGPTDRGVFLKLGGGLADYTGDMPAQNAGHPFDFQEFSRGSGFPFVLHGELGYQLGSRWALLLGVQVGNYPIIGYNTGDNSISDSWRYTPQLLVRRAFGPLGEAVVFYLDGGVNATFGGRGIAKTGYGPSIGGGVDVPVGRSVSLYVESRFNFTLPDEAIDGSVADDFDNVKDAATGPFDSVNQLLGMGLRIRF